MASPKRGSVSDINKTHTRAETQDYQALYLSGDRRWGQTLMRKILCRPSCTGGRHWDQADCLSMLMQVHPFTRMLHCSQGLSPTSQAPCRCVNVPGNKLAFAVALDCQLLLNESSPCIKCSNQASQSQSSSQLDIDQGQIERRYISGRSDC